MKGIFVMPPYQHQFVCLASSIKHEGLCIAGKIWDGQNPGSWIRPVSNRPKDSISNAERTYGNGQPAQLLDLTTISFSAEQPHPYQNENHIILHPPLWASERRLALEEIEALEDRPEQLWELGHRSRCGVNDRVPEDLLTGRRQTLYLIRPQNISVTVSAESAEWNNPKLTARASFTYSGNQYALSITDERAKAYFLRQGVGVYHPPRITYFTVSLGEIDPHTNCAYKLVAAIL
ncbi:MULTISPECIES: dual OB domain-containing protein [Pseudomonas]|uniref:dual OB domain-containing protein n=1 Tax=unclassified Pseudomonas TaxID=196821 RepID=UPI00261E3F58|nr:hypothetical protein [Pseudomonas sp. 2,4-D]MDN4513557.1 hypothetical protein [Pseudomonas sp. 2,4-D]